MYSSLFHIAKKRNPHIIWIGLVNYDEYSREEQKKIRQMLSEYDAYPVFLKPEVLKISLYFHDVVIRGIFHNFISYIHNEMSTSPDNVSVYREMNSEFASVVLSVYKQHPNAIILFNDTQLLLAPKIVSETENPHMGYFFHGTFPNFEIYRAMSSQGEILESLLCCDIVGFQVYEHARHFFTSCNRVLGLDAESRRGGSIGIIYKGRDIIIRVSHTGVSEEYCEALLQTEEYKKELSKFGKIAKKRYVIASVDRLSTISGIKSKLIGYRELLRNYPKYYGKVLLIQYCTPGIKCEYTEKLSKEIKDYVMQINKEFPTSIIYGEIGVSNEKRMALFSVAEILLITTLRDGFCLYPFEFLLVKEAKLKQKSPTSFANTGSIILSEFSGCASAMSSICRVNPYIASEVTYSILAAIESRGIPSKFARFQHDIKYIHKHDASVWIKSIMEDIKCGHNNNETALYLGAIENKILKAGLFFEHLTSDEICKRYIKTHNRIILLDCEGTIMPIMSQTTMQTANMVSARLKLVLEKLCSNPRNTVYILSGKPKYLLEQWFGDIDKLGLSAEFGYKYRNISETEWQTATLGEIDGWKEKVNEIFSWYKERTDGSEIEIKDGSIVWLYKESDPELGNWQAKELEKSLQIALADYSDIMIIHGKSFVEVKFKKLEKGIAAKKVLEEVRNKKGNIDFVLCMGDDISDEHMIQIINSLYPMKNSENCSAFTCTVGRKPSHARYYVDDYKDSLCILESLISCPEEMEIDKNGDSIASQNGTEIARPIPFQLSSEVLFI